MKTKTPEWIEIGIGLLAFAVVILFIIALVAGVAAAGSWVFSAVWDLFPHDPTPAAAKSEWTWPEVALFLGIIYLFARSDAKK